MTNVVELQKNETLLAEAVLKESIAEFETKIDALEQQHKDLTTQKIQLKVEESNTAAKDKKAITAAIKGIEAKIKAVKNEIGNTVEILEVDRTSLAQLKGARQKEYIKQNSEESVLKTFEANNLHFVITGSKWWAVDPDGDRTSPKINSLSATEVKDLIFYETDWSIRDEAELKQFAKSAGRLYKHIVRDFSTRNRPHTYNQMTDIRKYWLEPTVGEVHPAFRLLTRSIAGGSDVYADQIERIVAYRYCHPEDVMIPNIDSCATGGTGRDTLFNILRTIFTDECCAEISEETISGTHNGDLFGKMWVKVSEKDSRSIPIDKIKNLTGDRKYRHRAMGENAHDAIRLFVFMFFRNGYTTTARLAGTGSSGEDRRFEPIIARYNLARHIARWAGLIEELDSPMTDTDINEATLIIKKWQTEVYRNEAEVARWLQDIIVRHHAESMTELLPLHGEYYTNMLDRQKYGIEVFMPKIMAMMNESNCLSVPKVHKLYEVAENQKVSKDWFKNQITHWLNTKHGWDCEVATKDVWPNAVTANLGDRRRFAIIRNRKNEDDHFIFNIEDFVEVNAKDEKGNLLNGKITPDSIKVDLL
jgi:hypothetical protein